MPQVYNKYHGDAPKDAVYIGRPTKWGNPFSCTSTDPDLRVSSREEAVAMHREWVLAQPAAVAIIKKELKGRNLLCFCKPKMCHGDTLLEVANG